MIKWIAAGVVVVAAVIALIVWTRGNGDDDSTPDPVATGSSGAVTKGKATIPTVRSAEIPEPKGDLRLEGQVIDDAQQPVAGAIVSVQGREQTETSAADGSFAFDGLVAKRYRVSAHAGDLYGPSVAVRLGPTSEPVILHMVRGATLTVHVVDEHGPIAGASATLDREPAIKTDAAGTVVFRGVADFFHGVEVTADGYEVGRLSVTIQRDPGAKIDKTLTLRRGAPVSGVVLGPDGKPVANAHVEIEPAGNRFGHQTVKADDGGAWTVAALGAGKYTLTATSKVYGPSDAVVLELDGATPKRDVVLHVAVDAQLVGTVVDEAGKPVEGASIVFASTDGTFRSEHRSDAAGHFEILGFAAGTYAVFARDATRASALAPITVALDERADVRLVVQASGISGIVVDDRGEPVAEAKVRAIATDVKMMLASVGNEDVTDSHGHFDLGALAPGDYRVLATWPDQEVRGLEGQRVKTGTTDAKIVLAASATLAGRVTLGGAPVPFYGVLLSKFPSNAYMGRPTGIHVADGRFALHGIPPQTTSVVIVAPGSARKVIADVTIVAGKTTDLGDIALAPGQHISGHVHDASGAPVEGAEVAIGLHFAGLSDDSLQQLFRGVYATTTDGSGAYSFDGVAPVVRETIAASHPTRGASAEAALPAGDGVVDLTLVATGGIDGVVEGMSNGMAMVTLYGNATRKPGALESDETFRFDNVVPGDYTVEVMPMPGTIAPPPAKVTVVAGARASVKLVVGGGVTVVVTGTCEHVMLFDGPKGLAYQTCSGGAATFEHVPPGSYRACTAKDACTPFTVTATPAKQTVALPAPK